ncbi:MAG: UPF0280 family protein [Desulfobacterium sp.]|jgi:ApbE superfamily uncharacterized protein (UPF0280 family)|nr:UPF0280 family protein [Desulfobacterium sp.]
MFQNRTYRTQSRRHGLVSFNATVKETDLYIQARSDLAEQAVRAALHAREMIEAYLAVDPQFLTSLVPLRERFPAPPIIMEMIRAAALANVGPMAAVAGAVAEFTGRALLNASSEVIVENGGDIFMKLDNEAVFGIYAGNSPLSMGTGVRIKAGKSPVALCTSSGTLGHSKSFGRADAVTVISTSCALADAAATALGNIVQTESDVQRAINRGVEIPGVSGIIIIKGKTLGAWGEVELVRL